MDPRIREDDAQRSATPAPSPSFLRRQESISASWLRSPINIIFNNLFIFNDSSHHKRYKQNKKTYFTKISNKSS